MTLREAAASNNMPVERLREGLGLPAGVSPDARLGQLRQQYGFTMDQVRQVVEGFGDQSPTPLPSTQ